MTDSKGGRADLGEGVELRDLGLELLVDEPGSTAWSAGQYRSGTERGPSTKHGVDARVPVPLKKRLAFEERRHDDHLRQGMSGTA